MNSCELLLGIINVRLWVSRTVLVLVLAFQFPDDKRGQVYHHAKQLLVNSWALVCRQDLAFSWPVKKPRRTQGSFSVQPRLRELTLAPHPVPGLFLILFMFLFFHRFNNRRNSWGNFACLASALIWSEIKKLWQPFTTYCIWHVYAIHTLQTCLNKWFEVAPFFIVLHCILLVMGKDQNQCSRVRKIQYVYSTHFFRI